MWTKTLFGLFVGYFIYSLSAGELEFKVFVCKLFTHSWSKHALRNLDKLFGFKNNYCKLVYTLKNRSK